MTDPDQWYSQDAFWEVVEPALFNPQRQLLAQAEVDKIVKLLPIGDGARILDLCCGNGRHTLELARRGFVVVGVDRTRGYVARARQDAAQRGLDAAFVVSDMRDYCEPNSFDIVLNLFGSFGYFADPEDDRKVVENVYASLRPGGQFLLETMGKEILARGFQARDWSEEGDVLLLTEKKISRNWGRVDTRYIAIRGAERTEHRVSIRSYSAVELSALFSQCGFAEPRVYGSLDGIEYNQAAQRLVMVGRK